MKSRASQLRFPRLVASAITVIGAWILVWVFAYPQSSQDDIRLITMQVLTGAGTLVLSTVAMFSAVLFLIRHTPLFATIYSWSALGVVAAGTAFLSLGYSPLALDFRRLQEVPEVRLLYDPLRTALFLTPVALLPAVIAHVLHLFQGRGEAST